MKYESWERDGYQPTRRMVSGTAKLARLGCSLYVGLLAVVLLFIGNPTKFIDSPTFVSLYRAVEPGLHVGLFACLAFLVSGSRWPVHPIVLVNVLISSPLVARRSNSGCPIARRDGAVSSKILPDFFLDLSPGSRQPI